MLKCKKLQDYYLQPMQVPRKIEPYTVATVATSLVILSAVGGGRSVKTGSGK